MNTRILEEEENESRRTRITRFYKEITRELPQTLSNKALHRASSLTNQPRNLTKISRKQQGQAMAPSRKIVPCARRRGYEEGEGWGRVQWWCSVVCFS
jgi:hypothetical protein